MTALFNKKQFEDMSQEDFNAAMEELRKINKKKRAGEAAEKRKLKGKIEQQLGQYILAALGITCYQLDPDKFKKAFKDASFDKESLKINKQHSAKYQLELVRKMRTDLNVNKRQNKQKSVKKDTAVHQTSEQTIGNNDVINGVKIVGDTPD